MCLFVEFYKVISAQEELLAVLLGLLNTCMVEGKEMQNWHLSIDDIITRWSNKNRLKTTFLKKVLPTPSPSPARTLSPSVVAVAVAVTVEPEAVDPVDPAAAARPGLCPGVASPVEAPNSNLSTGGAAPPPPPLPECRCPGWCPCPWLWWRRWEGEGGEWIPRRMEEGVRALLKVGGWKCS